MRGQWTESLALWLMGGQILGTCFKIPKAGSELFAHPGGVIALRPGSCREGHGKEPGLMRTCRRLPGTEYEKWERGDRHPAGKLQGLVPPSRTIAGVLQALEHQKGHWSQS